MFLILFCIFLKLNWVLISLGTELFSVEDKILQVLWCTFDDKDSEKNTENGVSLINKKKDEEYIRCICIREQGLLSLFMESGAFYYVPLPFMVN